MIGLSTFGVEHESRLRLITQAPDPASLAFDNTRDSGLDSVRFVSTTSTADQVPADLRKKMDDSDQLIVTTLVSGNHQGWLDQAIRNWINAGL